MSDDQQPVSIDCAPFRAGSAVQFDGLRYRIDRWQVDEPAPEAGTAEIELTLIADPDGEAAPTLVIDLPTAGSNSWKVNGRGYGLVYWSRDTGVRKIRFMRQPWRDDAPSRADQYEAERAALAKAIHRRVSSSSIARTVPYSVGDAERAAAAVVMEGWTPPEGYGIS